MVIPQSGTDTHYLVFERIKVGSALIQQIAIALHPADGVLHVDPPFTHRPIEQFVPGRQLPSRKGRTFEIDYNSGRKRVNLNAAERAVRIWKTKLKVSGGFRTSEGARHYARLCGFFQSAIQQQRNVFDELKQLLIGNSFVEAALA